MNKSDERRKNIVEYIKVNKTVSTANLLEKFNIKKATLSEDLKAIKIQGVPLKTTRGYVSLNTEDASTNYYETITNATIRQWLILLIISQNGGCSAFNDIVTHYARQNGDYCSKDTLHKDLQQLQKRGLLSYSADNHKYTITNKYYRFISPLIDDLEPFCNQYAQNRESHAIDSELARFHQTAVVLLCGFEDVNNYKPNPYYISYGKRVHFDETTEQILAELYKYPYQSKQLAITHISNNNIPITQTIAVGIVVYSIDKNRVYIIGETTKYETIIPIDMITEITPLLSEKNDVYLSQKYKKIFSEMFSLSTDAPINVRVRFDNHSFIYERLKLLNKKRASTSTLTISDDQDYLIYTDSLRGISDFSSYIRQYGKSAVVEEPLSLQQQMIDSAQKTISIYKEIYNFE